MRKDRIFQTLTPLSVLALMSWVTTPCAASIQTRTPESTPEKEAKLIAKNLKPISDAEWEKMTLGRSTEKYSVVQGDTLFDISNRLFGDPKYWPKIWSLNNGNITNPHRIYPGVLIAFSPGSGDSLPSVGVDGSPSSSHESSQSNKIRSEDWRHLPKQAWESLKIQMPPQIDPLGFDSRSRVVTQPPKTGFEPQAIPASGKLTLLGEIIGSRSEGQYLGMEDTVYIEAFENLQVGETYAITQQPTLLKSLKSDRAGYSYLLKGKVKILGVRDNLFVGRILTVRDFVPRGNYLIPLPKKIPELTPIPGPAPLQGVLIFDHHFSTYTSAQHKEVFIDKGSDDGLKPGMIFRAYQHYDPANEKKVTDSDYIIDADLMVTQVAETISSAIVIHSKTPIIEHATVVLLTDITDIAKHRDFNEKGGEKDDLEKLDQLDSNESLGKEEMRELKQLERWKGNRPEPAPSSDPSTSPSPSPDEPTPQTEPAPAETTAPESAPIPDAPPTEAPADNDAAVFDEPKAPPPSTDSSQAPATAPPPETAPPESAPEEEAPLPPT